MTNRLVQLLRRQQVKPVKPRRKRAARESVGTTDRRVLFFPAGPKITVGAAMFDTKQKITVGAAMFDTKQKMRSFHFTKGPRKARWEFQ